jgi:hypothetical protein
MQSPVWIELEANKEFPYEEFAMEREEEMVEAALFSNHGKKLWRREEWEETLGKEEKLKTVCSIQRRRVATRWPPPNDITMLRIFTVKRSGIVCPRHDLSTLKKLINYFVYQFFILFTVQLTSKMSNTPSNLKIMSIKYFPALFTSSVVMTLQLTVYVALINVTSRHKDNWLRYMSKENNWLKFSKLKNKLIEI